MAEKSKTSQTDLHVLVKRTIPENTTGIKFDNVSYKIFMLIEDKQNLYEIYKKSSFDKKSFVQAVKKLYAQGLLSKITTEKYISDQEIEAIKSSLASYVGPVAPLILDKVIASLGFSQERLSEPKIELLIEKIADEIPFDKALEFKEDVRYIMKNDS